VPVLLKILFTGGGTQPPPVTRLKTLPPNPSILKISRIFHEIMICHMKKIE